ncbi:MAG TPA: phosphatase PAP2 family protein [Thermoanaerobaculia bacterium]|nr:phosphatase PAP2 family protein [Thermoanaerobaculia bacterium]
MSSVVSISVARDLVARSLARPYRVTFPMVLLLALVPFYIFIPALLPPHTRYFPELALDRALPLLPSWALIYGALYLFLIVFPILAVRDEDHIRRTVYAYLFVWIIAYAVFILYPTQAPRPARVVGEGFAVWGLQALYSSDPPYNCFPSLHVAHSFVSALTLLPLHRRLGIIATVAATLVALSTLFTKQHYVLDAVAGVLLALVAWAIFLRAYPRDRVAALDRQAAPAIAVCVAGLSAVAVIGYWILYLIGGQTRFDFGP